MRWILAIACTCGGIVPATAHDGLHVDIQKITAQIEALETPDARLHLLRAQLFLEHEKPDEALADLDRVRQVLGSEDSTAMARIEEPFVRAKTYLVLGRTEEGATLLDTVIERAGESHPKALDARAELREAREEWAGAIDDRRCAFTALPTLDRALTLGTALRRGARLDAAATHYEAAIAALGESRTVRDAWISVEIERGEYERALGMIDAELDRAANRTPWYLRRAEVYAAAGNEARRREALDAALTEVNRVIERRPMPIHLAARARVHLERGDLDRAEADARAVLARVPEFLAAQEILAEIAARRAPEADERGGESGEGGGEAGETGGAPPKSADDPKKLTPDPPPAG